MANNSTYNYQPQVPSTEDGPIEYNYIPRFDGHGNQFWEYQQPVLPPAPNLAFQTTAAQLPGTVAVPGGAWVWDGTTWRFFPDREVAENSAPQVLIPLRRYELRRRNPLRSILSILLGRAIVYRAVPVPHLPQVSSAVFFLIPFCRK